MSSLRAFMLSALYLGCTDAPTPKPQIETPEQQFIAKNVRIEEMVDGRVAWRGFAVRSEGDLETTTAHGIRVTREPETSSDTRLHFDAPTGLLELSEGKASFENVRIDTENGATVRAETARYDESTRQVIAAGGVTLVQQGLTIRSPDATWFTDENRLELGGPIEGRWERPSAEAP